MKRSNRSDLPFGSEFSPSQIDLVEVLEIAMESRCDKEAFVRRVQHRFFSSHGDAANKLARNTYLAMKSYGIMDEDANLTDFGKCLYDARHDKHALYESLARHILLRLNGRTLVQCILDMQASGERVTLESLRKELMERGIRFPRGGKHPSIMRLWLEKAGVFDPKEKWRVNNDRLTGILGGDDVFPALQFLTREQRAFLLALANCWSGGMVASNAVAKLAEATGTKMPEKSLAGSVLVPLVKAGFIRAEKTTSGRGAKPFMVEPGERFNDEVMKPLLDQIERSGVDPAVLAIMRKPFAEVMEDVNSKDKYLKGLALEALAFKLMRLLDMDYIATRLRGSQTGGAEVDLLFHSARLVYSRWQVQCKNTRSVALEDVAKEVGLAHMLKPNAIVIVSTGRIGPAARRYAGSVMKDSNLSVIMVSGKDIDRIRDDPSAIVTVFQREAEQAMKLKKIDGLQ